MTNIFLVYNKGTNTYTFIKSILVQEDLNLKENLISDDLVDLVDDIFEIDYSELTDFDPKIFDLGEYFDEETRSNFDSLEPLTTPVPSSTTLKSTTTTISASGELGTRNHGLIQ